MLPFRKAVNGSNRPSKTVDFSSPEKGLPLNLAPADVRKEGPAYDLPIAVGILAASGQIKPELLEKTLVVGELSLDGTLRHVRGVLPMAALAREQGFHRLIVPEVNAGEAALIPDIEVISIASLRQLSDWADGEIQINATANTFTDESEFSPFQVDFQEIKGQEHVKRALEVAAAGGHNVFTLWTKSPIF